MLYIAICDDEEYYVRRIKSIIESYFQQKNISSYHIDAYTSGTQLLSDTEKVSQYKLLFLDINMREMNGIQAAQQVKIINPEVLLVFITGFVDYAVDGYRVEAVRYILKDMLEKMLVECMDTVLKKIDIERPVIEYQFIEGKMELTANKICYVENQKHKQIFHLDNGEIKRLHIYGRLDEIETELSFYGFIRIHKSYLVNMKYISKIENYKATLKTGDVLPIPREKFKTVKERYFEMLGEI